MLKKLHFYTFLILNVREGSNICGNIYIFPFLVPGVVRGILKKELIFLAFVNPGIPLGFLKKYQPIRTSRLAGYREPIYECPVLLYRYFQPFIVYIPWFMTFGCCWFNS